MEVPILTNIDPKCWGGGAKIGSAEMKFLRSVGGYAGMSETSNTNIKEEFNIFNAHNKILIFRLQWKCHVLQKEDR
jgi:hypothetical protein